MHPVLRATAERQLGVFTATDALRAGHERHEIRTLCESGAWVRLQRGVYIAARDLALADSARRRHRIECLAVLLRLQRPDAAVSSASAARLWGLPVRRDLPTTVRLTDPGLWRRGRSFHMCQAPLPPRDVTKAGPLRITSLSRTLIDCAREWELEDAVVAMDFALLTERTTVDDLADSAAAARHWRGATSAQRAVGLADGRAESPLESRGRLRLVGSGLPPSALQVEIRTGGRFVGVVDAWYEEAAVAVEFDGQVKYRKPWRYRTPSQVLWDEKLREDALRSLDIRVVRVVDRDVERGWPAVDARLRSLLASPGPAARRFTATPRAKGRLHAA